MHSGRHWPRIHSLYHTEVQVLLGSSFQGGTGGVEPIRTPGCRIDREGLNTPMGAPSWSKKWSSIAYTAARPIPSSVLSKALMEFASLHTHFPDQVQITHSKLLTCLKLTDITVGLYWPKPCGYTCASCPELQNGNGNIFISPLRGLFCCRH